MLILMHIIHILFTPYTTDLVVHHMYTLCKFTNRNMVVIFQKGYPPKNGIILTYSHILRIYLYSFVRFISLLWQARLVNHGGHMSPARKLFTCVLHVCYMCVTCVCYMCVTCVLHVCYMCVTWCHCADLALL